jgi:hypothetical protein
MIKGHILNFTNTAKLRVRNVSDWLSLHS